MSTPEERFEKARLRKLTKAQKAIGIKGSEVSIEDLIALKRHGLKVEPYGEIEMRVRRTFPMIAGRTPYKVGGFEFDVSGKQEDIERRLAKVTTQEKEVKQVLKETADLTLNKIRKLIDYLLRDEAEAVSGYNTISREYGNAGWRSVFSKISSQETEHINMLRKALREAEIEFAQYGK